MDIRRCSLVEMSITNIGICLEIKHLNLYNTDLVNNNNNNNTITLATKVYYMAYIQVYV